MHKILFILLILITFSLSISAQKKGVIVSMETGVPIRDVKIYTNNGQVVKTDYMGNYYIPQPFKSVTIVKASYVSLTANLYELSDTTELLPKMNNLDEITVWGKRKKIDIHALKPGEDYRYYYTPKAGFSVDLFSIFNSKKGLSKKERRKHNEIIQTY